MRSLVSCVLALGLAGCYSLDDLQSNPVRWRGTYTGSYENLANCIMTETLRKNFPVTPQFHRQEQRAVLIVGAYPAFVEEYDLRQVAADRVELSWKSTLGGAARMAGKERAELCARPEA